VERVVDANGGNCGLVVATAAITQTPPRLFLSFFSFQASRKLS
jgi:hypothetical protein